MLYVVGHGQRRLTTLSGSLCRFRVNEFMYKPIAVVGFVWFSKTVLWFERQQIQMYRQGQLLCCSSREKKTSAPSFIP